MNRISLFYHTMIILCLAGAVQAAELGIVGKSGQAVPVSDTSETYNNSEIFADVMFNTAGTIDIPATQAGDYDNWGTHFLGRWSNDTGQDVAVVEFGWPCGGFWVTSWYVWISETLPGAPGTQDFQGSFLAESEDETEYPPSIYTYVDVSEAGIVIPAGQTMYFGYGNPGMAGQITTNGVETWSWYEGNWDQDITFNRTAVLQFKGNFVAPSDVDNTLLLSVSGPVARPNPFNPRTTLSFDLSSPSKVELNIFDLRGNLVRKVAAEFLDSGHHEYLWDGTDEKGISLGSGIYFLHLKTNGEVLKQKISLVR